VPIVTTYEVAEKKGRLSEIAKTPAKAQFCSGDGVAANAPPRGTVEILHNRAKTPKGPMVSAPLIVDYLMVAGAGFEPATFGL